MRSKLFKISWDEDWNIHQEDLSVALNRSTLFHTHHPIKVEEIPSEFCECKEPTKYTAMLHGDYKCCGTCYKLIKPTKRIEKLKREYGDTEDYICDLINKINELVDAVNEGIDDRPVRNFFADGHFHPIPHVREQKPNQQTQGEKGVTNGHRS